jgi:DNA-directed RNA polymerase subunit RPC12/RpoP
MFPFDDIINYELCFPGAVTGSTEVECPHCGELLTVSVDDPMGQDTFRCCNCSGKFDVNWEQETITPWITDPPELKVDLEKK